ncbi:unnamed protein product [Mesocestoides corti]|uniref:Nbl1_Borealin_N domain-containing protein n=1 Tax=Mesocestoides corti TaxID=53468 RepID=A0A0R3U8B9_MESCO|nr:unnamed protein product [Mesocestoides corti]
MPRPALRKDSSIVDKESAHAALAKILDAARANFERGIQGKRAVFERYLQTRVNWLRAQLTREAENSGTLEMNNLEVLRILKPHVLPKELRTPSKGLMPPPPPPSSLSALKTIRRMAGRPRMVQASTTAAKKFRSALNCSTTVASTTAGESLLVSTPRNIPTKPAEKRLKKDTSVSDISITKTGRPRRAAARMATVKLSSAFLNQSPIDKKPMTSVYDRDSVLFASSGSPVSNPFAHLNASVIEEINKILVSRVAKH